MTVTGHEGRAGAADTLWSGDSASNFAGLIYPRPLRKLAALHFWIKRFYSSKLPGEPCLAPIATGFTL